MATVLGFCLFLFFFGLASFGLVGADEPRYAQIAREMLARHDWVTPVLYGTPWLEKPALYYWSAMLSYKLFGVSDWAARIPVAVMATAMIFAIFAFMRRFRPGSQIDAALITASSVGVFAFARAASTDMPLTAMFTVGMLSWFAWLEERRWFWLAVFYAFMALGTLAKGPVAPFLAGLIIVVFALMQREPKLILKTLWLPGIALFLAIALPWYVAVQRATGDFFRVFILQHNLERFGTNLYQHKQPFWYYIPVFLVGVLPWTALALCSLGNAVRRWSLQENEATDESYRKVFRHFLALWIILPVFFFSFSQSKLPGYILPAIVPAGILLADSLWQRTEQRLPLALILIHSALGGGLLAAILIAPHRIAKLPVPWNAIYLAAGAGVLLLVGMLLSLRLQGLRALRIATLVPALLGAGLTVRVAAPTIDNMLSARPIAERINQIDTRHAELAAFKVGRDVEYGLGFYRNQPVSRYERGEIPQGDHVLIAGPGTRPQLERALTPGRRISYIGSYKPRQFDLYWISTQMTHPGMPHQPGS